jgi:UDP-2,3-diacylglucosamine hydrolase
MSKTKTYFASDFHLGVSTYAESLKREKKITSWLDEIKEDAKSIYLLGDIFDFWFKLLDRLFLLIVSLLLP